MSSYRPSEPEDLLLSQRNELFQIAFDSGFLSTDFEWTTTSSDFTGIFGSTVPMLVHAPSRFYFKFGFRDDWQNPRTGPKYRVAGHPGPHCLEYSPGARLSKSLLATTIGFIRRRTSESGSVTCGGKSCRWTFGQVYGACKH